jgi:hypothetical protein
MGLLMKRWGLLVVFFPLGPAFAAYFAKASRVKKAAAEGRVRRRYKLGN